MKKVVEIFYGIEIKSSMQLDDMLRRSMSANKLAYHCDCPPTEPQKELWQQISHLRLNGYVTEVDHHIFAITERGKQYLASGGFTGEAKKSKNALFAFSISIVALVISIITFLLYVFDFGNKH
jgi:hypothetical protein